MCLISHSRWWNMRLRFWFFFKLYTNYYAYRKQVCYYRWPRFGSFASEFHQCWGYHQVMKHWCQRLEHLCKSQTWDGFVDYSELLCLWLLHHHFHRTWVPNYNKEVINSIAHENFSFNMLRSSTIQKDSYCWFCARKSSIAFQHHFCGIVSGRVIIPPNRALTINDTFASDCNLVKLWEFKPLQGTRSPSCRACRCNDFAIQLHVFLWT